MSSIASSLGDFTVEIQSFKDFSEYQLTFSGIKLLLFITDYEISKSRIENVPLLTIPSYLSDSEKKLYLTSVIPFDSTNLVCAIGGLIKFLQAMNINTLKSEQDTLFISGYKIFDMLFFHTHAVNVKTR